MGENYHLALAFARLEKAKNSDFFSHATLNEKNRSLQFHTPFSSSLINLVRKGRKKKRTHLSLTSRFTTLSLLKVISPKLNTLKQSSLMQYWTETVRLLGSTLSKSLMRIPLPPREQGPLLHRGCLKTVNKDSASDCTLLCLVKIMSSCS